MYSHRDMNRPTLKRPNTIRFNIRHLKDVVSPEEVYYAIDKEIGTVDTIKCIAPLESGWFNVSFDNEQHCERMAQQGMFLKKVLIQCERANVQNTAVVYVKAPYEMADKVVVNVLMQYGTVTNIRRQVHDFDDEIETGVRSCMIKNLKMPIPSFLKVGGFTLSVRYRGQQRTCKICSEPGHLARECPRRGRCFICNSNTHRASWHDYEEEEQEASQTPIAVVLEQSTGANQKMDESNIDSNDEDLEEPQEKEPASLSVDDSVHVQDNQTESGKTEPTIVSPEANNTTVKKSFSDVISQPQQKQKNERQQPQQQPGIGKKTTLRPKTFWDEAVNAETTKSARKRKSSDDEDETENKLAKDDQQDNTNTDMELESNFEPDQESNKTDQGTNDDNDDFVPYVRKGVQRFRRKRGSGAMAMLKNDSSQYNGPSQQSQTQSQRGRGRGKSASTDSR